MSFIRLSIVIPVYNEAATLAQCVERVLQVDLPLEKELIFVDDASSDGSGGMIDQIMAEHPNYPMHKVSHAQNRGKGAALRSGFVKATGDIVIVQDADLEYDPQDYPRLLKPILDGRADVVYGSRFISGQERRVLYFWHSVGNQVLTALSNMCTNLNLSDMETCYKVLRRNVLESIELKSERFGIEPELTAKVARGRWRIYEVGISYSGRTYEEGKKITWLDGLKALFTILRFRFWD